MMIFNKLQGTVERVDGDVKISAIGLVCAEAERESNPYFTADSRPLNVWSDGFHVSVLDKYPEASSIYQRVKHVLRRKLRGKT